MFHSNTSPSQISVFGYFCVVIIANSFALFTFLHSWWLLSPSMWVPLFLIQIFPQSTFHQLLSLAFPHHFGFIYRPFNDKRKSGKQTQTQQEHCKLSFSLHLQKSLLTSVLLQDKVGQCLSCRAPQTLLVLNKCC